MLRISIHQLLKFSYFPIVCFFIASQHSNAEAKHDIDIAYYSVRPSVRPSSCQSDTLQNCIETA